MELQAPDGTEINGTFELVAGVANVVFDSSEPKGYSYEGGSSMDWDSSKTQTIAGEELFTDDDGKDWMRSHLIPAGAEPLSQDALDLMLEQEFVGRALDAAKAFQEQLDRLKTNGIYPLLGLQVDLLGDLQFLYEVIAEKTKDLIAAELAAQQVPA